MTEEIAFTLNGDPVSLAVDPKRDLLWVLRTELGLTGTKYGCGIAKCGACKVLVNGRAAPSCQLPMSLVKGKEITTIEGLVKNGELHPVQAAFAKNDALQCGFCTPGMVIAAVSLLAENPDPSREEIIEGMERNLCRCGAHKRIIDAIEEAAQTMKGAQPA